MQSYICHVLWMTDVTDHVPVRGGAHHAAEGDDWRDTGEVQEDD